MKRTVQFALLAVAVLLAIGITLYPLIANAYTERNRSLIETEYTEAISQMDNTALENAMQAARAYNASLRGVTGMTFSKEAVEYASASYEQLLNVHQDGIIAYVEIPKISVNLPIYHGAGDDSLNRGVGHLLGSALPVGGEATHCILTGHSGLAKDTGIGASGMTHDWKYDAEIVQSVKVPVIVAGGLGPENVEECIRQVKPAGVDSLTKTTWKYNDGVMEKDIPKVAEFCRKADLAAKEAGLV